MKVVGEQGAEGETGTVRESQQVAGQLSAGMFHSTRTNHHCETSKETIGETEKSSETYWNQLILDDWRVMRGSTENKKGNKNDTRKRPKNKIFLRPRAVKAGQHLKKREINRSLKTASG